MKNHLKMLVNLSRPQCVKILTISNQEELVFLIKKKKGVKWMPLTLFNNAFWATVLTINVKHSINKVLLKGVIFRVLGSGFQQRWIYLCQEMIWNANIYSFFLKRNKWAYKGLKCYDKYYNWCLVLYKALVYQHEFCTMRTMYMSWRPNCLISDLTRHLK